MFKIPPLQYEMDSFEKLSKKSFEIHYGKHHVSYINNLNELVKKDETLKGKSLEELIQIAYEEKKDVFYKKVFNNSAQHWNHSFFWNSINPNKIELTGELKDMIERDFGSKTTLSRTFEDIGLNLFGSGWVWFVYNKNNDKLEIHGMANARTPIQEDNGLIPLLVCDVWEHAYYIDYLNNRQEFLRAIFSYFDWNFAIENYKNR